MARKNLSPEERAAKAEREKARSEKRQAAVGAKAKARKEAQEKGLPWNDTIHASRFLEDYDKAFMAAIAGSPKVDDEPVVSPTKEELEAIAKGPVQTEKTAAQLTVEAAKQAMLGTSNDNEEPEAPTCTGVDVVTKENPESDVPAEEAPTDDPSGIIPAIDLADPSTWPLEANGGLMRLPGEPGKKFSSRKHKHKLWKREQAKLTETRNGDAPQEAVEQFSGDTVEVTPGEYNSDHDGQTLPIPEKSAAESANVFEAAAMGQTDEPANETATDEQTQPDAPQEAPEDKPVQTDPVEEGGTVGAEDDTPAKTPEAEQSVADTVPAKETPPAKPTLTLASSQSEDEALAARAQKFYGSTWTAERAEKLTKAFKFLEMAIRLQQKGDSDSRVNMPMTSAIRLETEALGIAAVVAKAA